MHKFLCPKSLHISFPMDKFPHLEHFSIHLNQRHIYHEDGVSTFLRNFGTDILLLKIIGILKLKFCMSAHHRTIQINHQPVVTIFHFIILTFIQSSTCFGRFSAHHQELNDCSGSLCFYLRIVVIVVLCSWPGRPAHPASCTMDIVGKERPGRDADRSPHSSAVVKKGQSYTSTPPIGRTACTEPQCLYKGVLNLYLWSRKSRAITVPPMGRSACTEPQNLHKGALYLYLWS